MYATEFCNGEKLPVYRFPSEVTEADNRKNWIKVCRKIRKYFVVGKETVVARQIGHLIIRNTGKRDVIGRVNHHLFFEHIAYSSVIRRPPPPPQPTKHTSNQQRNTLPDQIDEFEKLDRLSFVDLKNQ